MFADSKTLRGCVFWADRAFKLKVAYFLCPMEFCQILKSGPDKKNYDTPHRYR